METVFLALRVAVALAAVLGLIWFIQRKVSKSGGGKKGLFRGPKRAIQVVGTHRLAPKASVTVVEIDGERMVLGVTEHGISVLEHVQKPAVSTAAAVDAVVAEVAQFAAPAAPIAVAAVVSAPVVAAPVVAAPVVAAPVVAAERVKSFAELLSQAVEDTEPIAPVATAVRPAPAPAPAPAPVSVPAAHAAAAAPSAPVVEAAAPRRRGRVAIPSMPASVTAGAPLAQPAAPAVRRTPATPTGSAPLSTPIPASVASVTRALADAVPFFERLPVLRKAS